MLDNDSFIEDFKLQSLRDSARTNQLAASANYIRSVHERLAMYLKFRADVDLSKQRLTLPAVTAALLIGAALPAVIEGVFHTIKIAPIFHSHFSAHRIWFLANTSITCGRLIIPYALVGSAMFLIGLNLWNKRRILLSLTVLIGSLFLSFIIPTILGLISIAPVVKHLLVEMQFASTRSWTIRDLLLDVFHFGMPGLLGGVCAGVTFLGWNRSCIKLISASPDQKLLSEQELLEQQSSRARFPDKQFCNEGKEPDAASGT